MAALKLLAFILPLGLDSFAVAAAIGATARPRGRARWRITALFLLFDAGMPLLGLAVGAPLAHAVGPAADYLAAAAVVGIGVWMLRDGDDEEAQASRLVTARGAAIVGLGLAVSLDELAIGFSIGLTHLPAVPVLVGVGVQAVLAAQLGLSLGARIGERFRENAERIAGIVLIALGLALAVERLTGR